MRRCGAERKHPGLPIGALVAFTCWLHVATAQEIAPDVPEITSDAPTRRGEMAITYQYNEMRDLVGATATFPSPPAITHLLDFNIKYSLNEHWTLAAGLPLMSRKWEGAPSHDPMMIIPPHPESDFVDDGDFHTYFQDLRLGASYLLRTDPIIVEPYITLGLPASDYPFFAASAVGQHLKRAELGTTIAYRPPFLKWFFSLEVGYQFIEETLDVNVNATRVDGVAVYFVNPRLAVKGFFSSKNGKGLSVQPFDRTTEIWYQHDRMIRHNYASAGVGLDWVLSERNILNVALMQMVHAEDVVDLKIAMSVTLARSF